MDRHHIKVTLSHGIAAGAWLFAIACSTATAAAGDCPFIRPAGLSPTQVDQLVLTRLSESLERAPQKIDKSRTIKVLDGTDNAILRYAVFVVAVGETLGFDSAAAFYAKAKEKGSHQPFESLTVEDYQAVSNAEYTKGNDAPPPLVTSNSGYKLHNIVVHPPAPSPGWVMLRCAHDQIAFQRRSGSEEASTAVARTLSLPPFKNDAAFIEYTK